MDEVSNVYLVAIANSDNAHIRFTYWAESNFSFNSIIAIVSSGIVFLTLVIVGVFTFFIDKTIKDYLEPTVSDVRNIFIDAIEKIEPKAAQVLKRQLNDHNDDHSNSSSNNRSGNDGLNHRSINSDHS